jgi:alpha-galactosidase
MKFLLWFEPERVTRDSTWRVQHPQWVLRVPEAGQRTLTADTSDPDWPRLAGLRNDFDGDDGVFDLGNDEACTYLIDYRSGRVDQWAIDTYRNDFNFAPLEFWRHNDEPDRQGIHELKYVAGLYELFDELHRRHPQLRFDNCASGGKRIDVEMLGRAGVLSRSDYLNDPIGHQCHTYGLSQWVPIHATLPHTGFGQYAIRSGMTQGLSLSWAMEFNKPETGPMELDFESLRRYLDEFNDVRRLFSGDFYPLTGFSTSATDWMAYQFDSPDAGEGLALFFRRDEAEDSVLTASLQGLALDQTYHVWLDGAAPVEQSGSDLRQLTVRIDERPGSVLVRYRRTQS